MRNGSAFLAGGLLAFRSVVVALIRHVFKRKAATFSRPSLGESKSTRIRVLQRRRQSKGDSDATWSTRSVLGAIRDLCHGLIELLARARLRWFCQILANLEFRQSFHSRILILKQPADNLNGSPIYLTVFSPPFGLTSTSKFLYRTSIGPPEWSWKAMIPCGAPFGSFKSTHNFPLIAVWMWLPTARIS